MACKVRVAKLTTNNIIVLNSKWNVKQTARTNLEKEDKEEEEGEKRERKYSNEYG